MATATPSEDDSEENSSTKSTRYVCPICLESLKTPRSLPCLHTFCEDCSQTFITAAAGKNRDDAACPVCRKQIVAPEPGLSHEKWAKSFPLNYYLSTSFQSTNDAQSDVTNEMENCRFCEKSSKSVPAEHYCKNCAGAICEACKNLHQVFPALSNHAVLTLESYKKNPTIPEIDEICPLHPSKVIEVYCLDHSKMCCSVCFATKHRHCKDVKSIEECAEDLSEDVLKLITTKLESLLESVEVEIKEKENIGEQRRKFKEDTVVKMTQCIEAAKKNLDILLQQFESDIDRKNSSAESQLQNILKMLQGIKISVIGDKQMLESANKYGSKTQLFVALEKMKIQLGEQMKQISDVANVSLTGAYTIDFDKVEGICNLKSLSTVETCTSSSSMVALTTLNELNAITDAPIIFPGQRLLGIEPRMINWVEKCTNRLQGTCHGATFLGRRIAIIAKGREEIVVLKENGSIHFQHKIPYSGVPADINSRGDDKRVHISFRGDRILKGYYIDKTTITELEQISLQHVAEGFCIFDDKIVHASKDYVYISGTDGQLRYLIPNDQSRSVVAFLGGCTKRGIFYYSDGIYLFSRKLDGGNKTKTPLSHNTKNPRGIGIDFQGNVYVCCYDSSNKLIRISHKDKYVDVALNVKCYTISFHPDGMSFVLIDFDGNVRVYAID
ncbi:hypothetical protein FSP39_008261 [Pinctada imbricata]|uniref:Uncharacterized protein n=1 Tax=Pinctada imbricata TaxID=66713 RepID=A0AA88XGK1_PINIB|nr:hypothetical protein FSP39_008261 [Pinctada imbricata]